MNNIITIIDYGMGNLQSVAKKVKQQKGDYIITSDKEVIANASKIILPGVGHFHKAMENLNKLGLINTLNNYVLEQKKPILGICLGLQLMAKHSEEGNTNGLAWIDAEIVKFKVSDTLKYKVPHMGWNQISLEKESLLMKNIPKNSEFYFVHSYHLKVNDKDIVLNNTVYDYNFVSAIEKDNIFGVQYHPEKSHDVGAQLIKNFINL